jgi:hypothetical protein
VAVCRCGGETDGDVWWSLPTRWQQRNAIVAATTESGPRTRLSLVTRRDDGVAPMVPAARYQISAESEPVTARLGPRFNPISSTRGWVTPRAASSAAAGKLLTATDASAPTAALSGALACWTNCAGLFQERASAPRATATPKTPSRDKGPTASQTARREIRPLRERTCCDCDADREYWQRWRLHQQHELR